MQMPSAYSICQLINETVVIVGSLTAQGLHLFNFHFNKTKNPKENSFSF